jgi:hypothetical protein
MDATTQIGAAALLSFFLQWLKSTKYFPWITAETAKLNHFATIVGSGLVAIGLNVHFDKVAHVLTISNLSWAAVGAGAWHWFTQYALTHGWFKATNGNPLGIAAVQKP